MRPVRSKCFEEYASVLAYFNHATLDDKSRSFARHFLSAIGVIRFQQHGSLRSLDDAIDHLESVNESASVWIDNLILLSLAYTVRGNPAASEACQHRAQEVNVVCQHFIQQHRQLTDE